MNIDDRLNQRFEYTFELAWKVMQDYLLFVGYKGLMGPRNVIKQMGQDDLIDPYLWEEMIGTRNELTHQYNEEQSRINLNKIINNHFPVLKQFKQTIEEVL
ncbi:MAG: nucleotidyltransferase substrate binding protein [Bacteroidales bacterium]|nr:nucleotidyltransferase substrate binding protein [Bacteroidales bacterium]